MNYYNSSALFISLLAIASCSNDKDASMITPTVLPTIKKEWKIPMSSEYENPAPSGTGGYGKIDLQLFSDNSLKYSLTVNGFASDENFVSVNLHAGDVITNGPVILYFNASFVYNTAAGTIKNLRQSLIDSLMSDANEIYVNIESKQVSSGLLRGQLNTQLDWAYDVSMSSLDVIPQLNTDFGGKALLRLTANKDLYVRINLPDEENWTSANIHMGKMNANGAKLYQIYSHHSEFGSAKKIPINDASINDLKYGNLYLNALSIEHPAGGARGNVYPW